MITKNGNNNKKTNKIITMRKGQMSLQMIVGLVILLTVAVVTIRMFLGKMEFVGETNGDMAQAIQDKGFEAECESLCNEYKLDGSNASLAKYCYTKMEGNNDLNGNGLVDSFKANTKLLDICEDAIYCFHVVPCESETKVVDWGDCRQAVCDKYLDDYDDETKANGKIKEIFPDMGSCDIGDDLSWWDMYFGDMPCTFPPGELVLRDCVYDGNELICETNCKHKPGAQTIVAVASVVNEDLEVVASWEDGNGAGSVGSISFEDPYTMRVTTVPLLSSLNPDTSTWNVILVCNSPEGDAYVEEVS